MQNSMSSTLQMNKVNLGANRRICICQDHIVNGITNRGYDLLVFVFFYMKSLINSDSQIYLSDFDREE